MNSAAETAGRGRVKVPSGNIRFIPWRIIPAHKRSWASRVFTGSDQRQHILRISQTVVGSIPASPSGGVKTRSVLFKKQGPSFTRDETSKIALFSVDL